MESKGISPEEIRSQDALLAPVAVKKHSRKRRITVFIVLSIVNVSLFVLLWTQLLTPVSQSSNTSTSDTTTLGDITSPLIGKSAPDFTLTALNGSTTRVQMASFKGRAVVLNFWSSTCEPCKAEMPFLQKSWSKLQTQGTVFIGIDEPESTSAAQGFLHTYRITYPNVQDTIGSSTTTDYGVTGTPETIFINKDGLVVAKWISPLTEKGWQLEMNKLSHPVQ